jgi:hypothetical protein
VSVLQRHDNLHGGILIDPDNSQIDKAMSDLQSKFKVQDEGDLSDYLRVKIRKHSDV